MTDSSSDYTPPAVWVQDAESGGRFAKINRPTAGARHEAELPVGKHDLQLYSLATPNGVKVTVMLEELLDAGHAEADYDAWLIDIMSGDQFGSGFVGVNPNSKIPALYDRKRDVRVFESGAILLHLAETFGAFLPASGPGRTEALNWLFWLQGSAPILGGGFGHFYAYAPSKMKYPIDRYTMEVKRQLDVLDRALADRRFIAGEEYTIADMAIAPWYGSLLKGKGYKDAEVFLSGADYTHVHRYVDEVMSRPAYRRGEMVNRPWGPEETQLRERHAATDFETATWDKVKP